LPENLPRCLQKDQTIEVNPNSWDVLPIFKWLATEGNVSPTDMLNTFNMGIGFVVIVPPDRVTQTLDLFAAHHIKGSAIGTVISGSGQLVGLPE